MRALGTEFFSLFLFLFPFILIFFFCSMYQGRTFRRIRIITRVMYIIHSHIIVDNVIHTRRLRNFGNTIRTFTLSVLRPTTGVFKVTLQTTTVTRWSYNIVFNDFKYQNNRAQITQVTITYVIGIIIMVVYSRTAKP